MPVTFPARDGALLAYRDEGAGLPLLCLPGLTRTMGDFDYLRPHLPPCRLIRMDYRGRGGSAWTGAASYTVPQEAQDALAMIATNREFHAVIARAGRNPYYESLCLRLLDEGRRLLRMYYSSFEDRLPHRYVQEHDDLIAVIEARDVAQADKLAATHADQIVQQIQALISQDRRQNITL